jgi:methylglutaconyl-CoA hydratase
MTEYQTIKIKRQDAGAVIILNRPEVHNALNEVMIAELTAAVKTCIQEPSVRYLVVQGEGKSLCAGADIHWMRKAATNSFKQNVEDARKLADLFETIYWARFPVIIHAKGSVFGGGVGLTAVGDIVIAEPDTVFSLSEVRLGIIPAVISPYIIRAMGERQARRYTLTAERFSGEEAQAIGLVHQVVASESVPAILSDLQASLLLGSPMAQQHAKNLFNEISGCPIVKEVHELTARAIAEARASSEGKEGLQAFLDKRKPTWTQKG